MPTVGLDLGGTNIYGLVLDDEGEVKASVKLRTPTSGDRLVVVDVLEAAVRAVCDDAGIDASDLAAVGVGTPGLVMDGTVGGASNVPGWSERFALADILRDRIGVPIRVANDVTAAAVAEHRLGAGQGFDNVLVVFVGTGVGAGMILHGRPYEGSFGGAGEFGHTVIAMQGAVCPCGRRGCVEAYAGRRAMERAAERAVANGATTVLFETMERMGKSRPTSGVFRAALEAGDDLTASLLHEAIGALGAGIGSAVNLLDVDAVVLGGGLADKFGDWFLIRVESALRPHLFQQPPQVRMLAAQLGDAAGATGAALLAADGT